LARACGRDATGAALAAPDREAAFAELMRLVMISIRAGMGRRLRDHRESADVCQSVAKSFVEDFESGRVSFETEAQVAAYLQRVVQSKLVDLARHDAAAKRGGGGGVGDGSAARGGPLAPAQRIGPNSSESGGGLDPAARGYARGSEASADMRTQEAMARVMSTLSEDDQVLVRMRGQGLSWEQIAGALGKESAAVRQQFSRIQRKIGEL